MIVIPGIRFKIATNNYEYYMDKIIHTEHKLHKIDTVIV